VDRNSNNKTNNVNKSTKNNKKKRRVAGWFVQQEGSTKGAKLYEYGARKL